jgi:hypothetical protein
MNIHPVRPYAFPVVHHSYKDIDQRELRISAETISTIAMITFAFYVLAYFINKCFFEDRILNGRAKKVFPNGTQCSGMFKNDELEGEGEKRFANGDVYSGIFHKGLLNGKGKKFFFATQIEEEGQFERGWLHGKGIRRYPDGRQEKGIFDQGRLI